MKINMEDQMASACLANLRVPLALKACLAFLLLQGCQGLSLAQENWNQFRGPRGDGIAAESALPVTFDEFRNVRWKTSVPGDGWSSPVIWEDEIWLTSGSDKSKELRVVCVSLTSGKIKHNVKVFDMLDRKINKRYKADSPHLNSPATPTPVVEEKRVFLSFGSQGLACIDRKNCQMLWQRRDLRIYQPVRQGSSPIVDDSNLYVAFDGNFEQYFVALDKFTGQTVWKRDRNIGSDWADTLRERGLNIDEVERVKPGDNRKAFATATLINVQGHEQLIAPAAEATIAYDPKTGDELWRVTHPGGFNVSARPIYSNGLVYVFTSGLNSRLLAIRPDGRGDVTDTHVAWSTSKGTPEIPSPIIVDGALFMVTAKGGVARCLDASTGHERWKKRLGGDHWASPIFAQGLLYFSNKQGVVSIVDVREDTPNLIASNKLDASFIASAAVAGSSLILRSKTHLYCVEEGHEGNIEQNKSSMTRLIAEQPKELKGKGPEKSVDWNARYERLIRSSPEIKAKVDNGGATKADVIAWMKSQGGKQKSKGKYRGPKIEIKRPSDFSNGQRPPIFSGPQAGERLLPFQATVLNGSDKGKSVDPVAQAKGIPAVFIFQDDSVVGQKGLLFNGKVWSKIAARSSEGLFVSATFLVDDPTPSKVFKYDFMESIDDVIQMSVSSDRRDGPGAYGLNRNVGMTVIVARDGKVIHNFAMTQPMLYPNPYVLGAIAEAVGVESETLMNWIEDDGNKKPNAMMQEMNK